MPICPKCKNMNIVTVKSKLAKDDYTWCRNCGWTSDGKPIPLESPYDHR